MELAALERLEKPPKTDNGKNSVATFSRLFMIESFSYLHVTMTYNKSLDEFKIRLGLTTEYRVSCP